MINHSISFISKICSIGYFHLIESFSRIAINICSFKLFIPKFTWQFGCRSWWCPRRAPWRLPAGRSRSSRSMGMIFRWLGWKTTRIWRRPCTVGHSGSGGRPVGRASAVGTAIRGTPRRRSGIPRSRWRACRTACASRCRPRCRWSPADRSTRPTCR